MRLQGFDKAVAAKIGVFALAQRGQRVEPFQFGVDEARMAHDQAAFRYAVQKGREDLLEVRIGPIRVGPGKSRVGDNAKAVSARAKLAAEPVDQQSLWVGEAAVQRQTAAALAHP